MGAWVALALFGFGQSSLREDEIVLSNGEKIQGIVVGHNSLEVIVDAGGMRLGIPKVQVRELRRDARQRKEPRVIRAPAPAPVAIVENALPPAMALPQEEPPGHDGEGNHKRWIETAIRDALGQGKEALERLKETLASEDSSGLAVVVEMMGKYPDMGEVLLEAIRANDLEQGLAALAENLKRLPRALVPPAMKVLGDRKFLPAAPFVASFVKESDKAIRLAALDLLAVLEAVEQADEVAALLGEEGEVAEKAAEVLQQLASSPNGRGMVTRSLARIWPEPRTRAGRMGILVAAGLKLPEILYPLHDMLNSEDVTIRRLAAEAYGRMALHETLPDLMDRLLIETDESTKSLLIFALGRIRSPKAGPPLISLLTDPSPLVRARAAAALRDITGVNYGQNTEAWTRHFSGKRADN